MKKFYWYIATIMCVVLLSACNGEDTLYIAEGLEHIKGNITDENGNALKGIHVEVFLDELLKTPYDEGYYDVDSLGNLTIENYALYTDSTGLYHIQNVCHNIGEDLHKDVYVTVTDTAGIYESQTKKGQIEYKVHHFTQNITRYVLSNNKCNYVAKLGKIFEEAVIWCGKV